MNLKKSIIFLLFYGLCTFYLKGQKPVNTSFFDKNGQLSSVQDAFYFRETTDTLDFYRSYYAIDTSLYFAGKIVSARDSSDQKNKYSGLCIWYYKNGNKRNEYTYDNNGSLNGTSTDYFENGKIKKTIDYENGKRKNKIYNEFGENGATAVIFEENFIDNSNKWTLSSNDSSSAKIKLGGFELSSKKVTGIKRVFPHKISSENYSVETIINSNYLLDSARAGLIFGCKDSLNYCYFSISKMRCYIGSVKNGQTVKRINGCLAKPLKSLAWNKLKIISLNKKIYYSINEEILFALDITHTLGYTAGLSLNTRGLVLFDNFIIKEYQTNRVIDVVKPIIKNSNTYLISNSDYGVQSLSTGLILDKNGLILTNAENFNRYNQILVELYINDSIKSFLADVITKDLQHNIAILKINNLKDEKLYKPAYSFCEKASIELESELFSIYFTKADSTENKPKIVSGKLKSKARFENLSSYFDVAIDCESIAMGGPVFTKEGELLGVINTSSIKNISSVIKLNAAEQLIFYSQQKFVKIKKTEKNSSGNFNDISRNIVLIKVK
ncbi:MAG: trypsin-like peptidase domain-containing protein [Bacteroidia bacterium]